MGLSKDVKKLLASELKKEISGASCCFVVDTTRLDSNKASVIRKKLLADKGNMRVIKNSVALKALCGTQFEPISKALTGQNAIVYGEEPVSLSKSLFAFTKQNNLLTIKGAFALGKECTAKDVEALAALPSHDEMLGMFIGTLIQVPASFVGTLNQIVGSFVLTLKAVEEKNKDKK